MSTACATSVPYCSLASAPEIALNLAREAGIERIVCVPVIHGGVYVNVPTSA